MKDLAQYFHLFIVDMLGMGSSGRPQFTAFGDVDACEAFFVDSFRHWKLELWKSKGWDPLTKKFYLAGHSLGGYVASLYALAHEHEVLKLLLLSPVGIPERPADFDYRTIS